jgi:hypothetical protein
MLEYKAKLLNGPLDGAELALEEMEDILVFPRGERVTAGFNGVNFGAAFQPVRDSRYRRMRRKSKHEKSIFYYWIE